MAAGQRGLPVRLVCVFFNDTATTEISTLSLHDALPICLLPARDFGTASAGPGSRTHRRRPRSEEHTSEFQSRQNLVCRLLLEKKRHKKDNNKHNIKSSNVYNSVRRHDTR